ncbi:flagellar hook-length control protein FliK [Bradyrhizobium sp. KBS0727]|uniref:flagellar hook-length control protein FliK n=1 Tax=unclassified Bradyrhizobium TaxID=2631580 RepID=UPI00110ED06A|nr:MULTISPECIES: flagellar hook-length control protein FliK [unclassified Bradyrhizobium]QDW39303.1 flagellar hook-length control protein FliK [Bradyrhizobium sp. KBS0725]QDW45906.1 flagellar hook-length control protein FliK [Bradyrhizobium sp. KBS0727]
MAISINPVSPVAAAQQVGGVAPELVLQPGTVVNAQVLQVLSADLVRIAIASLSIDVGTQIPLQQGQALQLAVSQTSDGIRLALVGQGGDAAGVSPDVVTLSSGAQVGVASRPTIVAPKSVLTPIERAAVSAAVQTAATEQDSLAPLFANLGAAASSGNLPAKLQQAIAQVLAQQTSLDHNLDGSDIKTAFQKSGILLEASLASGSVPPSGAPDLKAALIVLRQTLQTALGTSATVTTPTASVATQAATQNASAAPSLAPSSLAPSSLAPSSQELVVQEILLPQARVAVAEDLVQTVAAGRTTLASALHAGPTAGATLNLLQEALQELGNPARAAVTLKDMRGGDVTFHTNTPPPPFRGSAPTPQPIASPSIAPDAPLATTAHHLLDNTDAAIARQTLLQVASLPDRIDAAGPRIDTTAPNWNFEIPFVTPQGTAMAQFEISRDGGGQEVEAAKRVWRARFSIDVEPSGPIHAQVSLTGDKTSVRMWAERPATAVQLRAGVSQLSQALSRAELQTGDIVIRDGNPPQATPARAGHFLDRAL